MDKLIFHLYKKEMVNDQIKDIPNTFIQSNLQFASFSHMSDHQEQLQRLA